MIPPDCAWCLPGTPAAEQRNMGARVVNGVTERVYTWLCELCIDADVREGQIELDWKRRG